MKHKLIMGIQVIPHTDDFYATVDRAIAEIDKSGLRYEVCPMETVIEGEIDELMEVAKRAHRACLEAGAKSVITHIKLAEREAEQDITIDGVMGKYR